ncbi:hypothetical protein Tco_1103687 [Tanacetum coccineum]
MITTPESYLTTLQQLGALLKEFYNFLHEGYQNTIELPDGNYVVPLRLVQNGCSFHGLWSEDPNQHLKDFLKIVVSLDLIVENRERTRLRLFQFSLAIKLANSLNVFPQDPCESLFEAWTRFKDLHQKVPHHGIDLCLQVQIFYDHVDLATRRTIDQSAGGKLCDKNTEESLALIEDIALYDNESWNDPGDFAKLVKAISLPHDVLNASDRHLIELENQVQRLMETHLAPKPSVQVNKIASSCEICSGPHDTQYCMENPEQAFVDYAASRTNEAAGKWFTFKPEQNNLAKKIQRICAWTSQETMYDQYPIRRILLITYVVSSWSTVKDPAVNAINDELGHYSMKSPIRKVE